MKRLSRWIAAAAMGVCLAPAWGATGKITANPSTCTIPAGAHKCTVYVTWSTEGAQHARVFVSGTGKSKLPEREFVSGRACEGQKCPASWIEEGTTYVFTLYDYSTGSRGAVLGSTEVRAAGAPGKAAPAAGASGTLKVTPNPCRIPAGKKECTVYVTWSAQGVQHAKVYVAGEGVKTIGEREFASSRSCEGQKCPATWIEPNERYTFTLFDTSTGSKVRALANVTVTATDR